MTGWTCREVRDPTSGEIICTECHHADLGVIRSTITPQGRQRWTWFDQRGRESDPFGTLHEAKLFAIRQGALKYA